MTYLKVLEQCSLSENRNAQETDNVTKTNIGRQSVEGTTVKEIELITKEKQLEHIQHEQTKADIQPLDETHQTTEIKESFTIEPVPSKLVYESNTPAVVSVEKTQITSLEYSQVEAGIKEKKIVRSGREEERIKTEIESQIPITVSSNDNEKVFELNTKIPQEEKLLPTTSTRKESTTQVKIPSYVR
jgi:hypothetical protein